MNAFISFFMTFKSANAVEVDRPDSILLVQDAHFNPDDQMQIELSKKCVAAVSTDIHLPNQYCQGNCVGWESGYLSDSEFFNSCRIDNSLISLASEKVLGNSYSSCFSPFSPLASHVLEHFPAAFPSSCQSACQDRDGCDWFSVIRIQGFEQYRCLLLSLDALSIPLALTASGDNELCQGLGGSVADCAFGSNLCLQDARSPLTPFDLAILNAEFNDMTALSGPKFCLASSNSISDSICTISEQLLHKKFNQGDLSDTMRPLFELAMNQFHGVDHLNGAVALYDENEWNAAYPSEQRNSNAVPHAPFIDIHIRQLIEEILADNDE